jgi:hypothetical protein
MPSVFLHCARTHRSGHVAIRAIEPACCPPGGSCCPEPAVRQRCCPSKSDEAKGCCPPKSVEALQDAPAGGEQQWTVTLVQRCEQRVIGSFLILAVGVLIGLYLPAILRFLDENLARSLPGL